MRKGIGCGGAHRAAVACALMVFGSSAGAACRAEARVEPRACGVRSLTEILAGDAVEALRLSAWHEGEVISPVVSPLVEVTEAEALEVLCAPPAPRGAAVWQAMRLGRTAPDGPRRASAIDASDVDLDRACALLACEAVVPRLRAIGAVPAELVALGGGTAKTNRKPQRAGWVSLGS